MKWHVAFGALLCLISVACQQYAPTVRVERTVYLMGTTATFVVEATDRPAALKQLERMVRVVESTEAELSTWREDSVLSRLNGHPVDTWLSMPDTVCVILREVAMWHRITVGAFDPAIGSLVAAWDIRGTGRVPARDALAAAVDGSGFEHVAIAEERCAAMRSADVTLDAGGFGKGAAIARVVREEQAHSGAWLIDFGGQVAVSGSGVDGPWPVAIAHPLLRETAVVELLLGEGSVATSGGSERDLMVDPETRVGHIVDPRTGQALTRASSVTVWHEDPLAADALSTALYVMGTRPGLEWAEDHGIAAYFVTTDESTGDLEHLATSQFETRFLRP